MKALGWILLFLAALSMGMCTNAGPETQAFVMSPAGAWTWLLWLGLLIGGVTLIVYHSAPGDAFGRKALLWAGSVATVAAAIATVAVILPAIDANPENAPSTSAAPGGDALLEWCVAEHARLSALHEEIDRCVTTEEARSQARLRGQETPRISAEDDIPEEPFWAIVCGATRYQRAHETYQARCGR